MLRLIAIIALMLAASACPVLGADATLTLLKPTAEEAPTREAGVRLQALEAQRNGRDHYRSPICMIV